MTQTAAPDTRIASQDVAELVAHWENARRDAGDLDDLDIDREYAEARARDIIADRRLIARLEAADDAGELVTHDWDDACGFGVWHEGPCDE